MIFRKVRAPKPLVPKELGLSFYKKGAWRSKAFRDRVAQNACLLTGLSACWGKTDPHHVKILEPNGTRKPSDAVCVPLCRKHHTQDPVDSVHGQDGEKAFWKRYGIDPRQFIGSSKEGRAELERIAATRAAGETP
jgi:hypothetical protein